MARRRGTFTLSSNIELEAGAPLDSRDIVQNKADLTNGSFPYSYVGMETYVRSEDKKYRLIGDDPTVLSNWVEVGSGSGSEVELVEISEEDYAALTTEEKNDPTKVYFRYEAIGLFKSVQDDPEATAFEGEKLATGRTIESVVDGKLEGKLDLTGGTMTGDLLTDTQTDIHAQRNLYLGNNGTSEESEGRSKLHFRRKGGGTNGITTLTPLQNKGIDDSYDENHYTQHLQCKSGTIALLDDVNKKADSETVEGSTSVSGNPIVISDAANSYAEEVIANIEPIQDLHGYDHPWVGGAGKNLLPMTVDGIKAANTEGTWNGNAYTINGVTFTILTDNDENVIGIKANGTVSARIDFAIYQGLLPEGNYMLNGYVYTGDGGLYFHQSGSRIYHYGENEEGIAISVDSSTAYIRLGINAGVIINNLTFKPMIRLSTETDASFKPYSNICPISGLDSVEVERCGFNVWDGEYEYGAFDQNNGEKADVANPPYRTKNKILVSPSKTYYLKASHNTRIFIYSKTAYLNNFVISPNSTFTTPSNAYYINFQTANDSDINNYCINVSDESKNGTYEPYTTEANTTSLPQTVYGGTLNIQTGELVVDRVFKSFNGSETWGTDSRWANSYYTAWVNNSKYTPSTIGFGNYVQCNKYYGVAKQVGNIQNGEILFNVNTISSASASVILKDENYASVDDFKASLSLTPLQIVYELATPQIYKLIPQQVKLLLEHNNISTNADTLDIVYQVNNVLGEILSESEEYTDRAILDYLKRNFIYKPGDVLTFDGSKPTILYGFIQNSNQIWIVIPLNKLITASAFTANITTIYVRTTNKTLLTVTPIKYQIQTMDTQKTQLVVVVNCIDGSNTTPFANLDNSPCIPIIIGTITFE